MTIDTSSGSAVTVIGLDWTDEALVLFLCNLTSVEALPLNVLNEDPFRIEPWKTRDTSWFIYNNDDSGCSEKQHIRVIEYGYWKQIETNSQKLMDILGEGRKIIWEFYLGFEPSGKRTGWQILEYRIKQKEVLEINEKHEFNSLCRFYLKEIDAPVLEVVHDHFVLNENQNDHLMSATKCMVPFVREQGVILGAERSENKTSSDNCDSLQVSNNLSGEDFLELKDFENDSQSSTSDDSSCSSSSSDECFDSEAMLQELKKDHIISGYRQIINHHSLEENEVDINVPPASCQVNVDEQLGNDVRKVEAGRPHFDECSSRDASLASGHGESSRLKRAASRSSEGSRGSRGSSGSSSAANATFRGSGRSRVWTIKRFGKYCCFGPF